MHHSAHLNEGSQILCYYSFAVNSDRCIGSFNTLNDLSDRIIDFNKAEDLNWMFLTWLQE